MNINMNINELKKQKLNDESFKQAYDEIKVEYDLVKLIISTRIELNITQKELAERTGISQANISKLENGNYNPTLTILKRLAKGLGKELIIDFK